MTNPTREALAMPTMKFTYKDGRMRACADILMERFRQCDEEGWTEAHDDEHDHGELAAAAACYAMPGAEHVKPAVHGAKIAKEPTP